MGKENHERTTAPTALPQDGRTVLESRMERLSRLVGTDEGFFLLALHSFMESYVCDLFPAFKYGRDFAGMMWDFKDHLASRGGMKNQDYKAIVRIQKEHITANRVRHGFLGIGQEEVTAATYNFLDFCRVCGISHPLLEKLREGLKAWEEKVSPLERSEELRKLRYDLFIAQRENKKLLQQAEGARQAAARAEQLEADLRQRAAEYEREKARADAKVERLDALRAELNNLGRQKETLAEELSRFKDLDSYVEHLARFTAYTRTRRDYERGLMRLSAEQKSALDAVTPGHDFLVKGGAGTGKTIVLLKAFARARTDMFAPRAVLLTYTTTLVKYDRYLAELLKASEDPGPIQTADSFFLSRLRTVDPAWRVDYSVIDGLAAKLNATGFLSNAELATEVEDFLFGNMVKRTEYVDERIPRHGMRQPLSQAQRAQVWEIRDQMAREMDQAGAFSKNYSRLKLIETMEGAAPAGTSAAALSDVDMVFVDESQDLTVADLKALKLMCGRGVVMAGDGGQAIYGLGSPYRRAGIDISGRTRILRTDFRTTCPIHDLAECYRALCGPDIDGEHVATHAFREGPPAELYIGATRDELLKLLVEKAVLFIEKLGYDPENVTVLAPSKADVSVIQERIARRGIASANVRDESFSFSDPGLARVSTLHSSKGLDFPVVLLYLPSLPLSAEYEEKTADRMGRNLIYVAMTRAMENLNVFMLENPREQPLKDLADALKGAEKDAREGPSNSAAEEPRWPPGQA